MILSIALPYDVDLYPDADAVIAVYGYRGASIDPTEVLDGKITQIETSCGPNIIAGMKMIFE